MTVKRKLINILGLTGAAALLSYMAAMIFAPLAFPGYDWMAQAVSDLSADTAPSRQLWDRLSAVYSACGVVCTTLASVYVSENRIGTKKFRLGIYLFTVMNWISRVGYDMFPLADSGKEIASFQEIMHMVITVAVVLLSIVSLILMIITGIKDKCMKGTAVCAGIAFLMMMVGAMGQGIVPPDYFGIVERFSLLAAVGFGAVIGIDLFNGFGEPSSMHNA